MSAGASFHSSLASNILPSLTNHLPFPPPLLANHSCNDNIYNKSTVLDQSLPKISSFFIHVRNEHSENMNVFGKKTKNKICGN